jgi:hypothetical protein
MTKWLITYSQRTGAKWNIVDFCGKTGAESRGIVDLLAIRKDHQNSVSALKRGDLFDIVLIQTKGGGARRPTAEDVTRLRKVARHHKARAVVLAEWRRKEKLDLFVLEGTWWGHCDHASLLGSIASLPDNDPRKQNPRPYNVGTGDSTTELEWNLRHCKSFLEQVIGYTYTSEVYYVRPPKWRAPLSVIQEYQKTDVYFGIAGNGNPLASDTKTMDAGASWMTGEATVLDRLQCQVRTVLRAGCSDIIVTLHDSNADTAEYLPDYLNRIEKAVYFEVGMTCPSGQASMKSLVEFVHDRDELRTILDAKISEGKFYYFPNYPEM